MPAKSIYHYTPWFYNYNPWIIHASKILKDNPRRGTLYKFILPDDLPYVGQTIRSYKIRKRQHERDTLEVDIAIREQGGLKDEKILGHIHHYVHEDYVIGVMNLLEVLLVDKYDSFRNGWNRTRGGRNNEPWNKGIRWPDMAGENNPMWKRKHTEHTKQLMSKNHADFSGENNPFYNKKHTEEAKEKMRVPRPSIQGKNHPMHRPEVKARFIGDNNPMKRPEIKAKLSGDNHWTRNDKVIQRDKEILRRSLLDQKPKQISIETGYPLSIVHKVRTRLRQKNLLPSCNYQQRKEEIYQRLDNGELPKDIVISMNLKNIWAVYNSVRERNKSHSSL